MNGQIYIARFVNAGSAMHREFAWIKILKANKCDN